MAPTLHLHDALILKACKNLIAVILKCAIVPFAGTVYETSQKWNSVEINIGHKDGESKKSNFKLSGRGGRTCTFVELTVGVKNESGIVADHHHA